MIELPDGGKEYRQNNVLHRENGPAAIYPDAWDAGWVEMWYWYGKLHREDGPAAIYFDELGIEWLVEYYHKGELHRDNGPAVERRDGIQKWYRHGKLHRDDGPAVIFNDESGHKEWWMNGKCIRK